METKRTFLALVLSFLVIALWGVIFPPPEPEQPPVDLPAEGSRRREIPEPMVTGESAADSDRSSIAAEDEQRVEIRSPLFQAELSNRGAAIRSWRLEHYNKGIAALGETTEAVQLLSAAEGVKLTPLAVITGSWQRDERLRGALYEVEGPQTVQLAENDEAKIRFRWASDGFRIEKEYLFRGDSYAVGVRLKVSKPDAVDRVYITLGPGLTSEDGESRLAVSGRAIGLVSKKSDRTKVVRRGKEKASVKGINRASGGEWPPDRDDWLQILAEAEEVEHVTGVRWLGLDRNYFAGIAFAESPWPEGIMFPVLDSESEIYSMAAAVPVYEETTRFEYYLGPKDTGILQNARPDLAEAVDFGFFSGLARLLFRALELFHGYVGNWGVAIILLTIVIKLLFAPLHVKQLRTSQKMAKLGPRFKALESKYARMRADPKRRMEAHQKMHAERQEIMRKEGVNPVAGCLPLLMYMPFLWGFYQLLQVSIELRHAPFVLWIQDLSSRDPFYVTPILMVISMIVQQAITPTAIDPMQRRIMYMMPLIFGFVLINMASGLVLFWLTQNVLSIVQQLIMNRWMSQKQEESKGPKGRKR